MKVQLAAFFILTANVCFGMTWNEMFDVYSHFLPIDSVLRQQHEAYISSSAPTIADPRIKEIPIYENGEELIDLREITDERIQMLPDPTAPFESPYCNSGLPSASKIRWGLFVQLQHMIDSLDGLAKGFGYEPGQICIKVFEGLRDVHTQKELFHKKMEEVLLAQPQLTIEEAEAETAKWVSPYTNNVPVHSTGAAIDIRLWDNQREDFLDMGTFGVIWGSNNNASTFSENISDEQKRNRLYCLIAAEQAGLTNYVYEF